MVHVFLEGFNGFSNKSRRLSRVKCLHYPSIFDYISLGACVFISRTTPLDLSIMNVIQEHQSGVVVGDEFWYVLPPHRLHWKCQESCLSCLSALRESVFLHCCKPDKVEINTTCIILCNHHKHTEYLEIFQICVQHELIKHILASTVYWCMTSQWKALQSLFCAWIVHSWIG